MFNQEHQILEGVDNQGASPDIFTTYQAYAVAKNTEIVKRFKVQLRDGTSYSIPYSLLPIIILTSEMQLIIKAYELFITITGRSLQKIEEALSAETLIYIRQSPSGNDDGQGSAFIEDIQIQGETLMH